METCTVACRHPGGLVLQLYTLEDSVEPAYGGGTRPIKVARKKGAPVVLNGPRLFRGADAQNPPLPVPTMSAAHALTHGVSKDFLDAWAAANADSDLLRFHVIFWFASEKLDHVKGRAKDHKDERWLEPLDVDSGKDPRIPRRQAGVGGISTATTSE
jgi:hypothetical protein